MNNFLLYILYCQKSGQQSIFLKKFNFLWNQLDAIVFCFFTRTTPQKNLNTEWPVVEQRQDQHEVWHVWSMGVLLSLLREIQMSTQVIWIYFTKKCQNKVNFPDDILNFSKMVFVLPSTLCMAGELWLRRFIWHQDIRVTHCQSSAMSFIFTQYSFCNSFRHGLIYRQIYLPIGKVGNFKYVGFS